MTATLTRILTHLTPTCSHGTRLHTICGPCIQAISTEASQ